MKFFLILIFPIIIFANTLKDKYDYGDMAAGIEYAKELYSNKKYKKAAEIFLEIAQTDNPLNASFYLGEMFEFGHGVNKSCNKSALFYWESISQGYCDAYINISKTYNNGGCLKKDLEKSIKFKQSYIKCQGK